MSRLERLFTLLDTGSSADIRATAARQIGQLAAKSVRRDVGGEDVLVDSSKLVVGKATSTAEWQEVMSIVARILPFLQSKSSETRSAASKALLHTCSLVPVWSPSDSVDPIPPTSSLPAPPFPSFSLSTLLRTSPLLLASSGTEYTKPPVLVNPTDVARARKEAIGRLGLGFLETVGEEWQNELVEQNDVNWEGTADVTMKDIDGERVAVTGHNDSSVVKMRDSPSDPLRSASPSSSATLLVPPGSTAGRLSTSPAPDMDLDTTGLSTREINRLKRKRKPGNSGFVPAAAARQKLSAGPANKVRIVASTADGEPEARRINTTTVNGDGVRATDDKGSRSGASAGGQVDANENALKSGCALEVAEGVWVWQGVVEVLGVDLFSPNWEIRHGAALGLREVIKVQGSGGGMRASLSGDHNALEHEKWCNDLAAKLLCVFALDRFGDFVSDTAVAPVRETVSQSLASLLLHMPPRSVMCVHSIFLQMINQDFSTDDARHIFRKPAQPDQRRMRIWEVMHAGLLGLKYELAVRGDLIKSSEEGKEILTNVIDAAVLGMSDSNDDVQSVAASCLLPVAGALVSHVPTELARVIDVLWQCCEDLKDDLGSSVGAVMELLGKLVTFEEVISIMGDSRTQQPLRVRVPMLYPLFRHTIPSVRMAVVQTIQAFLAVPTLPPDWITTSVLRLLFQNLVLEEKADIRHLTFNGCWRSVIEKLKSNVDFEATFKDPIRGWYELVLTPLGSPIESALLFSPTRPGHDESNLSHNVDKSMLSQDFSLISVDTVLQGRILAARGLALLISAWPNETQMSVFGPLLQHYMVSPSALQRSLASIIIEEWAREEDRPRDISLTATSELASAVSMKLVVTLESDPPSSYHEMLLDLSRIRTECQALLDSFSTEAKVAKAKIPMLPTAIDTSGQDAQTFELSVANQAVGNMFDVLKASVVRKKKELAALDDKRRAVVESITRYAVVKEQYDVRVLASVASAAIAIRVLPFKLNPLVRSLMNGVKFESNQELQARFARAIASFVLFCSSPSNGLPMAPSEKIVKNLCAFVCQDVSHTLVFNRALREGILTLKSKPSSATIARSKGTNEAALSEETLKAQLVRRGAQLALKELALAFGPSLFDRVPAMWDAMAGVLQRIFHDDNNHSSDASLEDAGNSGQNVIDSLEVLEASVPNLDPVLYPRIASLFPIIVRAARSSFAVIRRSANKCFATLCNTLTIEGMQHTIEHVIPFLGDSTVVTNRQGAMELISNVVEKLGVKALPYVIFLVVPVLGRMSDQDDSVRLLATNTFAALIKMVPLEAGLPDPPGFSTDLLKRRAAEREFLSQLLDGSKVQPYHIPVTIKADLRPYQQDGVNWLAFLAKYHLHGILCDDMGLGKTLQSICILASKHHERAEKYAATKSPDSVHLPSLIICPPTLIGHWYHEILNYTEALRPAQYSGNTRERQAVLASLMDYDIVISSYDVVRNDISSLSKVNWNYCILDEGHIIKNGKTKITKAIKQVRAEHRLILSGTPIQNNVLELWSLFDFLMPGFLGSEQSFNERFSKPILSTRDRKGSAKHQEAGVLALEALHKQVLPFLLRRLKEDVLKDLPPKIIQDFYCELSELQKQLYDEFSKSQSGLDAMAAAQGSGTSQQHVFRSLQYLRKLCNHPALVIKADFGAPFNKAKVPKMDEVRKLENAPKLQALRQILSDCGIGDSPVDGDDSGTGSGAIDTTSQHRVLIFCQMKQMLDMIEEDLFKAVMPSVTYMRLDGGTDSSRRHAIVQTFNADPTIDCLLLTTHVGGLGLNLTGADTVIFVEHDWNPMKDLQAMDRAHRIGQKKVVNVYRLITRGTLEEKIMGLQRFKLNIANSVVNQQNSGLTSMDTDVVLDLFKRTTDEEDAAAAKKLKEKESKGQVSQKNVLEGLEDLQAEDEYSGLDLSSFMGSLPG